VLAADGEVYFDSVMRMDGIKVVGGEKTLDSSRFHKCVVCGSRGGYTQKCKERGCKQHLHPICMANAGHRLELRAGYLDGKPYVFCPDHQHSIEPPPRPEGFREEDVAGLLDGYGVCNRKRWVEAVEWVYDTGVGEGAGEAETLAAALAAAAAGSEARDRLVANKEKDKGWRNAVAAANAALLATRFFLTRHEELMMTLAAWQSNQQASSSNTIVSPEVAAVGESAAGEASIALPTTPFYPVPSPSPLLTALWAIENEALASKLGGGGGGLPLL